MTDVQLRSLILFLEYLVWLRVKGYNKNWPMDVPILQWIKEGKEYSVYRPDGSVR